MTTWGRAPPPHSDTFAKRKKDTSLGYLEVGKKTMKKKVIPPLVKEKKESQWTSMVGKTWGMSDFKSGRSIVGERTIIRDVPHIRV